jgi:hypothetical protein
VRLSDGGHALTAQLHAAASARRFLLAFAQVAQQAFSEGQTAGNLAQLGKR